MLTFARGSVGGRGEEKERKEGRRKKKMKMRDRERVERYLPCRYWHCAVG